MNVLRSSPVLPVACLLQSTMRCCCAVSGLVVVVLSCANAVPQSANAQASASENCALSCMVGILSKVIRSRPRLPVRAVYADGQCGRIKTQRLTNAVATHSANKRGRRHADSIRAHCRIEPDATSDQA